MLQSELRHQLIFIFFFSVFSVSLLTYLVNLLIFCFGILSLFVSTVSTCRNETHEVIKYLEYCVHRLHNEDPGVHNLLLSLYAKQVMWLALYIHDLCTFFVVMIMKGVSHFYCIMVLISSTFMYR